jgi:hypothetical protein
MCDSVLCEVGLHISEWVSAIDSECIGSCSASIVEASAVGVRLNGLQ